jgi:hypothetical protein
MSQTKESMDAALNLQAIIAALGYRVQFVDYCECADTPGLLGQIRGVTYHTKRLVRIGKKANPTEADMIAILAHEARHVANPDWDCGNGWKAPAIAKAEGRA